MKRREVAGQLGKTIDAEQLCTLTGLTDRHHRGLARAGWFPSPVRGQYQLTSTLQGLFKYYRTASLVKARSEYETARTREASLRADLMELERSHKSGDLIPSDQVVAIVRAAFQPVREALISLPVAMAARTNPSDPMFAREALSQWTDDALRTCREQAVNGNGSAHGNRRGRHYGSPKKAHKIAGVPA